ncbi:28S ribosomal protein S36, mitochondrial [Platysternon megacephalum]|uniref:28S ribosomal protein S36, mitochondrial n=1 Tax=Platysternon megacephalum TaxID=55544 RepID=A0A4D9F8Y8_9SAUR|nr:28S ribosomal protein S36, mitochondrial [Platysternon megacephalum]
MSVGDRPPALQNISSVSRVQGTPDTTELVKTLPQKYRRKLMSDEEMEYIQILNSPAYSFRENYHSELILAFLSFRAQVYHGADGFGLKKRTTAACCSCLSGNLLAVLGELQPVLVDIGEEFKGPVSGVPASHSGE